MLQQISLTQENMPPNAVEFNNIQQYNSKNVVMECKDIAMLGLHWKQKCKLDNPSYPIVYQKQ